MLEVALKYLKKNKKKTASSVLLSIVYIDYMFCLCRVCLMYAVFSSSHSKQLCFQEYSDFVQMMLNSEDDLKTADEEVKADIGDLMGESTKKKGEKNTILFKVVI